jgi:hypothetical protein
MLLPSMVLAGFFLSGAAVPVQNSFPQACFVFGEVFWSETQVSAMLSSNCPIHIERKESLITMRARHKTVVFMIPEDPGVHSFVYRWGNRVAFFDDEKMEVGSEQLLSRRSPP